MGYKYEFKGERKMKTAFDYEDEEFTSESITLDKINELTEKSLNRIVDSLAYFSNEEITRKMVKSASMGCTMLEYEVKWQGFPEFDELSDEVKQYYVSLAMERVIKFWENKNFKIHDNPELVDEAITIVWGKENEMTKESKSEQEIIDDIVNDNIKACDDRIHQAISEGKHDCMYYINWPNDINIPKEADMRIRGKVFDQFVKHYNDKNYKTEMPDEDYYIFITWEG